MNINGTQNSYSAVETMVLSRHTIFCQDIPFSFEYWIELINYVDSLHQMYLRNSLYIYGLAEAKDEDIMTTVQEFFRVVYGLCLQPYEFDLCRRVGQKKEGSSRAVLVNFLHHPTRQHIVANRYLLQGSRISVVEPLTPRRYAIKKRAEKFFGKNTVGIRNGRLFYKMNRNKRVMFETFQELEELVVQYIHQVSSNFRKNNA